MTRRSMAELYATVLKAARAGGVPLAQAEDVARASGLMNAQDLAELPKALTLQGCALSVETTGASQHFRAARVAVAGPAALDVVIGGRVSAALEAPDAPALLSALVALANLDGLGPLGLVKDGEDYRIERRDAFQSHDMPHSGIDIEDTIWAALEGMASLTYVPASDASRRKGAGAGLTDND